MLKFIPAILLLTLLSWPSIRAAEVPNGALITQAERSGWKITGRYEEAVDLCHAFAKAYPKESRCMTFGTSAEGRPMVALICSADGTLDPETTKAKHRPVMLFQGGIHAGEIDGKDAGFQVIRELLEGHAGHEIQGALRQVTTIFVPVFNVDGHERFGRNNRPNQRGPEEMGWRTTAQNLNLNRDYLKAEAPEMAAMLKLLTAWDPILYVDLHVTDGADFQHDVSVITEPSLEGPTALRQDGESLEARLMRKLSAKKHLPLDFYPEFNREDDPSSGFSVGVAPLRFSQSYWASHNRLGILVETHSWKDYATRVRATADTLRALLELTVENGSTWLKHAAEADKEGRRRGGKEVALSYEATQKSRTIDFLGYAYRQEPSDISGQLGIAYDPSRPEVWKIPLFYELKPALSMRAPRTGYVVPAAHAAWVAEKLSLHGVRYQTISGEPRISKVEVFRATEASFAKESFENRMHLSVKGVWTEENREIRPGSLFVPIAQPLSYLVMELFEPQAPDSFAAWGFFNSSFERKEYMESYVAERVAREMLAKDPDLRAEFVKKLASDAEFAKDPKQRLDFFYRRHPSWDERYNLYPVLRIE